MSSKKRTRQAPRHERRFFPQSGANPIMIRLLGGLGAMGLGAGAWGQFATNAPEPFKGAPWILATGALLFGGSIWLGTSGDPVIRVGDGGVGVDRGDLRRIPWHAVASLKWDAQKGGLVVKGQDETDLPLEILSRAKTQPQATAWILKEARERVPDVVDVPENLELAEAIDDPTDVMTMDPLQVVGRRCAKSDRSISYEPDARICTRCERVYHKDSVPKKCECGASLAHLRGQKSA
jgi:hypothetical protein